MAVEWQAAVGLYPHTRALRSGEVASDRLRLVFADMPTINRAFAPMVREARFDVSEMAIATFLQASVGQRQDILLKLLGARHYDAIGRLAGRRANDARARVDALAGELTGYADATEEAETAARERESELVTLLVVRVTEPGSLEWSVSCGLPLSPAPAASSSPLYRLDTLKSSG